MQHLYKVKCRLAVLFLVLISSLSYAQKGTDFEQVERMLLKHHQKDIARERKDLDPLIHRLDLLIESRRFINEKNIAALYALRAKARQEEFFMEWQLRDRSDLSILRDAMKDLQTAIDTSHLYAPLHAYDRLLFVRRLFHSDSLYRADSMLLVQHGWKNGYHTGLSLGVLFARDAGNRVGFRLGAWGRATPAFSLSNQDSVGKTVILMKRPAILYQWFAATVLFDAERDQSRYGLSALSFTKPFYFDPLFVGFQEKGIRPGLRDFTWFYRPSVGLTWKWVTVAYGALFPLSKVSKADLNRHEVFLLLAWPLKKRPL